MNRPGFAGDSKPDKDESHDKEQNGKSLFAGGPARVVRMVLEHRGSYETQGAAIAAIAPKIGCIPQTLGIGVRQAEKDSGMRDGVTSDERDRIGIELVDQIDDVEEAPPAPGPDAGAGDADCQSRRNKGQFPGLKLDSLVWI